MIQIISKTCDVAKIQVGDPDTTSRNGFIEGYASVHGVVDLQNQRVVKGAFAKTISSKVPAGKVFFNTMHHKHGGDVANCIGLVTKAMEDDYGLWVHAELGSEEDAQNIRIKAKEGRARYMSIGGKLREYKPTVELGKTIDDLLEIELDEITITNKPACTQAVVLAAKTFEDSAGLIERIRTSKERDTVSPEEWSELLESVNKVQSCLLELGRSLSPESTLTPTSPGADAEIEEWKHYLAKTEMDLKMAQNEMERYK